MIPGPSSNNLDSTWYKLVFGAQKVCVDCVTRCLQSRLTTTQKTFQIFALNCHIFVWYTLLHPRFLHLPLSENSGREELAPTQ